MKRTPERVESGHFLAKHNVSVVVHADQVEHRLAQVNADCMNTHLVSPRCGFVLPSSPDAARFTRQTILLLPQRFTCHPVDISPDLFSSWQSRLNVLAPKRS